MKSQRVLAKCSSRYQIIVISRLKMLNMLFRNAIKEKKSSRVTLVYGSRLRRDCITHLPKTSMPQRGTGDPGFALVIKLQ